MNKIIDADMEQARAAMVAGCRLVQDGPFADVEPFDPEKFVSDVIGS